MAAAAAAPAIFTTNTVRLADRIKIQCETIRRRDYTVFGRLTAVHFAAQRDTTGLSQSRPRYTHPDQPRAFDDARISGGGAGRSA